MKQRDDLKPGDVVYVNRIDSPLMSVREFVDAETVVCQWFDFDRAYISQAEFHIDQLSKQTSKPELKVID